MDKKRQGKPNSNFISSILQFSILTREQEKELASKAFSGDKEARNLLVLHNQKFLIMETSKFAQKHPNLDLDDLISEANIGLMRAAELYDPSEGTRFLTYAKFWVHQSLGRYADKNQIPVILPDKKANQYRKLKSAITTTGTNDSNLLATSTSLPLEIVKELLPFLGGFLSLDTPVKSPSGDDGELFIDLACPVEIDYDGLIDNSSLLDMLMQLPERQREVLMHRYGAFGRKRMTLQELSTFYGITRERVRQLESQALSKCHSLIDYSA